MADLASFRAVVYGRVQGVFFRAFTSREAGKLGLAGYVRNLPDGETVEVQAEGERSRLESFIKYLKLGPPEAKVKKVVANWSEYTGNYPGFSIRY